MVIASKNNSQIIKGVIFLLISALLYSIMPVLIRMLGVGKIPPMSQVFLRYIFACISAIIYFFVITKSKIKIDKKDVFFLAIITIFGYSFANLFITYAILNTQVGNALFLFYSYGIMTPILGFFILKEKFNKTTIAALIISTIALFLLFQPNSIPTWKIGGVFAFLSALSQSIYLILRKKLFTYSGAFLMLANTIIGVIVVGLMSLLFENSFYFQSGILNLSPQIWTVTILFGIDNFLGWLFMTKGFELFKASTGSLILLLETVFGILFALLFFKEIPTIYTFIGGLLILISSAIVILKNKSI